MNCFQIWIPFSTKSSCQDVLCIVIHYLYLDSLEAASGGKHTCSHSIIHELCFSCCCGYVFMIAMLVFRLSLLGDRYLMINSNTRVAIMRTYRCRFKFAMLIHIMMSFSVINNTEHLVSTCISYAIQESSLTGNYFIMNYIQRKHPIGMKFREK